MEIPERTIFSTVCSVAVSAIFLFSCATTNVDQHWHKGENYYEKGAYEKAEYEFKQVLRLNPQDSDAHYKLGVVYCKQGLLKKGTNEFLTVISLDKNYTKAYYNLGAIYSTEGPFYNVEKAVIVFNKYIKLEPRSQYREKIEQWLEQHEEKEDILEKDEKSFTVPRESSEVNLKTWLKEESLTIGEDDQGLSD